MSIRKPKQSFLNGVAERLWCDPYDGIVVKWRTRQISCVQHRCGCVRYYACTITSCQEMSKGEGGRGDKQWKLTGLSVQHYTCLGSRHQQQYSQIRTLWDISEIKCGSVFEFKIGASVIFILADSFSEARNYKTGQAALNHLSVNSSPNMWSLLLVMAVALLVPCTYCGTSPRRLH